MTMTRLLRHSFALLARLMLGLMLFAQLSNAAQACTLPDLNPAAALDSAAMSGCDDAQGANKNACLSHCLQDYQIVQSHDAPMAAFAMDAHHAVAVHIIVAELPQSPSERAFSAPPDFAERPRYLRFGHFLN
jgi:hypothetical protein